MNIDPKRLGLAVLVASLLAGCNFDPRTGHLVTAHPELGEASRQTFAAQVIDPDPQYKDAAPSSGVQAERAVEAYRKGAVEEPQAPNTSVSIGGSGGGGGSGTSGGR
jgi:type IV pilus biogenesis protein CpaD/CtpE